MIACFYNVFLKTAITIFPIKIVLQFSFDGFLVITFNNFCLFKDYRIIEWTHLNNIEKTVFCSYHLNTYTCQMRNMFIPDEEHK